MPPAGPQARGPGRVSAGRGLVGVDAEDAEGVLGETVGGAAAGGRPGAVLEDDGLAVARVAGATDLLGRPVEPAHGEDAVGEAMGDDEDDAALEGGEGAHEAPEGLQEGGDAVVDVGARLPRRRPPEEARVLPLVVAVRPLALERPAELPLPQPRVLAPVQHPHAGGGEPAEDGVGRLPRAPVRRDEAEDRPVADLRGEAVARLLRLRSRGGRGRGGASVLGGCGSACGLGPARCSSAVA
jgi:hypothetical protein